MKALKTRAWHKNTKKWLEPHEFAIQGDGTLLRLNQYPEDPGSPNGWTRVYQPNEFVIVRWTGEKDAFGKEIYESDFVEYEDWDSNPYKNDEIERGKGIVEWGHNAYVGYSWGWTIEDTEMQSIGLDVKVIKVIGNKFENPNLLK